MILKNILSILLIGLTSSYAADNGFWREGKDFPQERVNAGIKSVSPDSYSKIAEKLDGAVVNISTTQNVRVPKSNRRRDFPGPKERGRLPFDDFFGGDPFQ